MQICNNEIFCRRKSFDWEKQWQSLFLLMLMWTATINTTTSATTTTTIWLHGPPGQNYISVWAQLSARQNINSAKVAVVLLVKKRNSGFGLFDCKCSSSLFYFYWYMEKQPIYWFFYFFFYDYYVGFFTTNVNTNTIYS